MQALHRATCKNPVAPSWQPFPVIFVSAGLELVGWSKLYARLRETITAEELSCSFYLIIGEQARPIPLVDEVFHGLTNCSMFFE